MIVEVMIFGSFLRQLDDIIHKMLINQSITIGVGAGVMTSQKQDVGLSEELAKGGLCTTVELGAILCCTDL